MLEKSDIYYEIIGKTQKEMLDLDNIFSISIAGLKKTYTSWLEQYITN